MVSHGWIGTPVLMSPLGVIIMSSKSDAAIPNDVLVILECSVDARFVPQSAEHRAFSAVMQGYRNQVDTADESTYRKALADRYRNLVSSQEETLLSRRQRDALERCADGLPYAETEG
jgi:hypothetical protein